MSKIDRWHLILMFLCITFFNSGLYLFGQNRELKSDLLEARTVAITIINQQEYLLKVNNYGEPGEHTLLAFHGSNALSECEDTVRKLSAKTGTPGWCQSMATAKQ